MAIVNLCSRLLSCYGKYRIASPIGFTKHDHIFKGNVKPESLGAVMGTYRPLSSYVDVGNNMVNDSLSLDTIAAAKFAVEQHNHQNGSQLTFVGLVGHESPSLVYAILMLKVSDQTGKFDYVKAEVGVRRELLQSSPLQYMTDSEITKFVNSDG